MGTVKLMRFFNNRAGLPLLLAFAVLPLGCKHKPQVVQQKPALPPGDHHRPRLAGLVPPRLAPLLLLMMLLLLRGQGGG